MKINFGFCLIYSMLFALNVYSAEVTVVDGDSLKIGEQNIRLDGIDAPEYTQKCFDKKGTTYFCGQEAMLYLENMTQGKDVECKCLAQKDRYKRDICECFVEGISLNGAMVASGWAITYRDKTYILQENTAKLNKLGVWQGKYMRPAIYRALHRTELKTDS